MRAVPRDGEEELAGENGQDAFHSMRAWLASGTQVVDRRRRFGHSRARKLLITDPGSRPNAADGWQNTTAALQRHTVGGALSELEPEHRRLIMLAYLEGHTNRQLAAVLGVSVTTAKRRLVAALERLEMYISAAGAWLAAVLVGFSVYMLDRLARLTDSADKVQRVAATVAVGALAGAAVGVVTVIPSTDTPRHESPMVVAPFVPIGPQIVGPAIMNTPLDRVTAPAVPDLKGGKKQHQGDSNPSENAPAGGGSTNGCHSNPTGAPPTVPVRNHGHVGPPVSPPGRGGCPNL